MYQFILYQRYFFYILFILTIQIIIRTNSFIIILKGSRIFMIDIELIKKSGGN